MPNPKSLAELVQQFAPYLDPHRVPEQTQTGYKLFNQGKDGQLYPLFVGANQPTPQNVWTPAQAGELTATGQVRSKIGPLAFRPGWHSGEAPVATHIGGKTDPSLKAPNYRPANQVWAEVQVPDDVPWQEVANARASRNKAGEIIPRTAQITDQVPYGGHYRYKTNPNMTGDWLISGQLNVGRVLPDEEAAAIAQRFGLRDLPRLDESGKLYTFNAKGKRVSVKELAAAGLPTGLVASTIALPEEAEAANLTHFSRVKGLLETDPARYGQGIAGAEARRKANDRQYWEDRTYFGVDVGKEGGYLKEPDLGNVEYQAEVPDERLYDFQRDPLGLRQTLTEQGATRMTQYEQAIKNAGFAGYVVNNPSLGRVAAIFEKVPVRQVAPAAAGATVVGGLLSSEEAEAAPFGTLARELGQETQAGWHGSPHQFEVDRLLGSKGFTGEGNQAYAAGRYVSLDEGVATGYRDSLSADPRISIDGGPASSAAEFDPDEVAAQLGGGDPWQILELVDRARASGFQGNLGDFVRSKPALGVAYPGVEEFANRVNVTTKQGSLYGVEIPRNEAMLDWDLPIAQQPEQIRAGIDEIYQDMTISAQRGIPLSRVASLPNVQDLRAQVGNATNTEIAGQDLYLFLTSHLGSPQAASEYLRSKGIPGTTYMGQESGKRNAVLFGDEYTNVFSKDGQPFGADRPPPTAEVEEISGEGLEDLFRGKGPLAVGAAGLLGTQAATADGGIGALQQDAEQRAAKFEEEIGRKQAERAQGVVPGLLSAADAVVEQSPFLTRVAESENPAIRLGAELTGLPSLYRAGEEYLQGAMSPGAAVDVGMAAVPLLPVARGVRALDRGIKAADDAVRARAAASGQGVLRPGAEGYPGATSGISASRRAQEPRVEMPRLRVANAGRPKGTIVGLPKGVEPTPENVDRLAAEYAQRVVTGLEHGVQPGYFYQAGNADLRNWVGGDPYEVARASGQLAATSPQAPVDTNLLWQVRGAEQQAMGYPVETGKSWGTVRKDFQKTEESLARQRAAGVENPTVEVGGPKTKPFGKYMNDEVALAPNDRWEMFGIGYPRDGAFSPQERQMAHYIRQRAQEKLREQGIDLDLDHIQEIHWQAVRGPATNTPMVPGAGDTFQHSADPLRVQHNWEIAPGTHAQHMPEFYGMPPEGQQELGRRLNRQLVDEQGRDRLVAATGGTMQPLPFRETQGSFEGFPAQGYKSYSMSPVDKGRAPPGGLEKPSRERLEATEAARALALGQTAGSASVRRSGQTSDMANDVMFGLTEPLNAEEFDRLQGALDRVFGKGKVSPEVTPEGISLAHWEDPLRLRVAEGEFNEFGRNVKFRKPSNDFPGGAVQIELRSKAAGERLLKKYGKDNVRINAKTNVATIRGQREDWDRALASGGYSEIVDALGSKYNREGIVRNLRDSAFVYLPWEEGKATETFLSTLKAPRQREMFDSPQVREIMGNLAGEYQQIAKEGTATPNPKLVRVLEAWGKGGISAVEDLVKKGLAPAAAIGTAVAMYNQQGGGAAPSQPGVM